MNKLIKQAFTLIELLVVIAIIGILSGMIVVSMSGVTQKANIAKVKVFASSLRNSLMIDLVSEWKLDNNAIDTWGTNNGTLSGFTDSGTTGYGDTHDDGWMSSAYCVSGTCLKFDGVNDYIEPAIIYNPGTSNFTLSAWIKRFDTSADSVISFYSGSYAAGLYSNYSGTGVHFGTGASDDYSVVGEDLSINTWHHIVGTRDATTLKVYVNGKVSNTKVGVSIQNILTGYFQIGRMRSTQHEWKGLIDDIRIFNVAMPTSQIKEQYYVGLNNLLANNGINKEEYNQRLSQLSINK
ncbi:MAG: LamG-like jellyroll fold domain-containing protein [Candidatus Paceibacterota bacterium]